MTTEHKMEWEDIPQDRSFDLCRAKVPGGWLVAATEDVIHNQYEYGRGMVGGWDWRVSLTFVPDPNHEWVIK